MTTQLATYLSGFTLLSTLACGSAHGGDLFAACVEPTCIPSSRAVNAGASSTAEPPPGDPREESQGSSGTGAGGANAVLSQAGSGSGGAANVGGALENTASAGTGSQLGNGGVHECSAQPGEASALALYDGTDESGKDRACSLDLLPPRQGAWVAFDDASAGSALTASISTRSANPGERGCFVEGQGSGANQWGGGLAFALDGAPSSPCPYDASPYRGMVLYLSGSSAGTQGPNYQALDNMVRVNVVSTATSDEYGTCVASDGKCNDHYGVWCSVTAGWTRCDVPFDNLSQRGWGAVKHFDRAQLLRVEVIALRDSNAARPTSWRIAVDDVAFY